MVTSSRFSVLTLQCRRLSRNNKIQKRREGVSSKPGQHGALRAGTSCQPPPKDGSHEDRWGLGRRDFGFHCRGMGKIQPCWDHTTSSQTVTHSQGLLHSIGGGKCLLGGGSFWVSVWEKPVWIVTMTLIQERFVNAKQMSPERQNPHTSPEGSLTM